MTMAMQRASPIRITPIAIGSEIVPMLIASSASRTAGAR